MASYGLDAVPALSSNPQAFAQLYLDFNGDPASAWTWYSVPETPAFSRDADTTTFSDGDISTIREIWARVAEKYSPFNINVTTVDPGNLNDRQTLRAVIGGGGAWAGPGQGGISQPGGFSDANPNTVYIFEDNLGNGDPKMVAEVTAHEPGHSFGLAHQTKYSSSGTLLESYSTGDGAIAPIMGNSISASRGLWSYGTRYNATDFQDDLAILASSTNGFGYRADDHGGNASLASALTVSGNAVNAAGIIGLASDADYFSFTTGAGLVSFNIDVAPYGPMLDAKAEIRDASGALIASAASASLGETISATLPAGNYYLVVRSHGNYGDIGQYTVTGTVAAGVAIQPPVAEAGGPYSVLEGGAVALSAAASTGAGLTYQWDLDGDGVFGESSIAASRGSETGSAPIFSAAGLDGPSSRTVGLRVTDSNGTVSSDTATITIMNVAPTITVTAPAIGVAGLDYSVGVSATDPGSETITGWVVDWGDGSIEPYAPSLASATHQYALGGDFIVRATATDEDGSYTTSKAVHIDEQLRATPDTTAPTATLSASDVLVNSPTHQFTVTYRDAMGINLTTIGDSNVVVTGPDSVARSAVLTLIASTGDGTSRTATYAISAPGGTWGSALNGTYTVSLQPGQVRDLAGNAAPAGALGTFQVNVPTSWPRPAQDLGLFHPKRRSGRVVQSITPQTPELLFAVTLEQPWRLTAKLTGFRNNIDMDLVDSNGQVLATSARPSRRIEATSTVAAAGTYYVRLRLVQGSASRFKLFIGLKAPPVLRGTVATMPALQRIRELL